MADIVLTGASRGIGRAFALALAARGGSDRLVPVARDGQRLTALEEEVRRLGGHAVCVPGDLSTRAQAKELGTRLAALVQPGATLIHNAGLWPSRRELTEDGLERAFVTNHLGPLLMQAPLIEARRLRRVMVVGAGLMVKGRFDAQQTPTGGDFSSIRTYCNTKLAFALAMRDVAAAHPELDVVVLHPGVVRTDLGARPGPVGWLLSLVKRRWEAPEVCAERLVRILDRGRWSPPGDARWLVEETESPWPEVADAPTARAACREVTARLLAG